MQLEAKSLLHDIQQAISRIVEFTRNAGFADYRRSAMMRSAVERQLEIIGEAVAKLSSIDPGLADRITDHSLIISFRNRLIHGYFTVDDRVVWDVVQVHLPSLRREIEALLEEE